MRIILNSYLIYVSVFPFVSTINFKQITILVTAQAKKNKYMKGMLLSSARSQRMGYNVMSSQEDSQFVVVVMGINDGWTISVG